MAEAARAPQQQTALARRQEQVGTIRDLLERSKDQIKMALPRHLTPERLMRVAMTTIQRNPKLLEADPRTLIGSIIQCAQLGLEPDGILGHAYLVPFWNSQLRRLEVVFIPGYKGLIALAKRGGDVAFIHAVNVYDKETFIYEEGDNPKLKHTPMPPSVRGEKKMGTYAVARNADGQVEFIWMWAEEIEFIRDRALKTRRIDTKTTPREEWGAWGTDEDEMFKKTAIRRLSKTLSLSPEFQKASALDEMADAGIPQNLDQEIFASPEGIVTQEMNEIAGKTAEKTEDLRKKLDAKAAEKAASEDGAEKEGSAAPEKTAGATQEAAGAGKEAEAATAPRGRRRSTPQAAPAAPPAAAGAPPAEDPRHGPTPAGPEHGDPFPGAAPPRDPHAEPPPETEKQPAPAAGPATTEAQTDGPDTPEQYREAIAALLSVLGGLRNWSEEMAFKALLAGSGLFGKYTFEQFQKGEITNKKHLDVLYRLGVSSTTGAK